MPKTHETLQKMGFVDMEHYVKIADNTYGNIMALLTGKRENDSEVYTRQEIKQLLEKILVVHPF